MALTIVFVGILGLAVGSFLNVVILRWPKLSGIIKGRSRCSKCKRELELLDLIPVFSFIFLRGRCRYCHQSISWQYPLVELSTAGIFALLAWQASAVINPLWLVLNQWAALSLTTMAIEIIIWLTFAALTIVLFVLDMRHMILPDRLIYPAAIAALTYEFILHTPQAISALISLLIGLAFFGSLHYFSKGRAMGGGDVKIMLFLAPLLVWPNIIVFLFLSFVGGGVISIFLLLFRKVDMKTRVPFGVFMLPAFWVTILLGEKIIWWYLHLGK